MTMEQIKEIFKGQGLTVHLHKRRKLKYVYGAWRMGSKVKQVYIAPEIEMLAMTGDQVQEKLAQKLAKIK